jgi:tetratricopeptide (TPR) repeat protein
MGRWDEALTVLKRISDAFVCLGTLCDLVEEALKQDNSTTVESLVNELLRTLATNKGDTPEWKVAKVISILGQLERFHDISRVFENLDVWETAVVASELAKSLSPAEISPIARLLDEKVTLAIDHVEPEYRIQVLGLAAQVSARTGNAPKARRLITEVLSQLGVDARDEDHSGRAVNSIEVGQKDRGGVKAWALLRSARALAYLGETKEAQHLLTHQLYGFSSQVEIILQEEVIDEAAQILIMIKEYSDAAFMPWTLFGNFRDRDTYLEKGLGRIAKELGEVGQYDHALAMLRHIIVNRQYLFDAMGAIGRAMADRGEFEKALELAGNINRVYGRLHLLSVISQDMARAGNLSGASQVLASALQLVKAWDTAALLHPDEDLILTLIRLSESLPPKDQDAPMLSSRTNPATKVRAVLELTKTHISGEDPQFIRKSVLENLTLVGEEKNPRIQAELYAECAGVAAYINDWDLVISIRETVKSMLDIGSGLKDNSRKSMSNLASRLRTLPSLNQNAQESMYRLLNLPVSDRRAIESAYHWIVSLLASQAASAGDLSRALGLATEIGESHTYQAIAEVLHRITLIFICHRNYNSAIFVAKQLRDEENVMVDTGHYDQMEDLTPVITQRSFYYSETVSELIKAWVEDERISEAKSFLDTIPNDYSRSMAMSALAGSLFRIGESSGADEAFAEALRLIDHCRDDCEATAARVAALFALIEMGRENEARQIMNTLRGVLQFKSSRSPETTGHIIRALLLLDPFDALNLVFEIQEKNEQLPALSFLAEGVKLT